MEVTHLKSSSRPFKATIEGVGEINFRYRPAAITVETLPELIALEDEPTVKKQRRLLAGIEKLQTAQVADQRKAEEITSEGTEEQADQPESDTSKGDTRAANAQALTEESIQEMAATRREEALAVERDELERAAGKLCFLLDPVAGRGHDLTEGGVPLPVTPQVLAAHLPQPLIEAVTQGILEGMQDPFGLASSPRASSGMPGAVPANGDA